MDRGSITEKKRKNLRKGGCEEEEEANLARPNTTWIHNLETQHNLDTCDRLLLVEDAHTESLGNKEAGLTTLSLA
ncbi:unnamed protein product [Pleuronectes platessa]|uniref:Uncharacterized protein n=1 Tax=Pleuronectes platessa TaxID=8262 RepID=A0A9N7Z769_PLEPL|nr:unnamed protein product [Pleuronectes platessa]